MTTSLQISNDSLAKRLPTIDEIEREETRRTCVRSLAEFVHRGWHVVEPATDLIWNWHLDRICTHLEAVTLGDLLRLIINIPPGHMKSLLVAVFWPSWVWTHTPTWRVLFTSYDMALSTRDSVRCRDLISSDWYQETFNPPWELKGDQNVKSHFANTDGGLRQALTMSAGGKGTGFRGDCVVGDDPHNVKEHPSDEELSGVQFVWDKRMSSRLNDPRTGARVLIHHRTHENDLTGHLRKKEKQYTQLILPTEFDPGQKCVTPWGEDPRTEPGELLFPELFPPDVIDEAKDDLGEYDFAGQHNQTPTPPGGGIIKKHWFRFWYPADVDRPKRYMSKLEDGTAHWHEQIELPKRFDAQLQSWDMTFKEKSKNPKKKPDFVVGQMWATVRKLRFLLDQVRDRMSFTMAVDAVRQFSQAWPQSELKLVEDGANGPAITDELETEIGGFELVTPAGGKEIRAHSASHTIRAGYVYLPHPDVFPWVKALIHEVCVFPRGANDDQLDTLTQLINYTRESASSVLESMTS